MGAICTSEPSVEPFQPRKNNGVQAPAATSSDPTKPPKELIECLAGITSLVSEVTWKQKKHLVTCTSNKETRSLTFGAKGPNSDLHVCELSDSQLMSSSRLKNVKWTTFFSSLKRAFRNRTLGAEVAAGAFTINIPLEGETASGRGDQSFPVTMSPAQREFMHNMLLVPLLDYYFECKASPAEDEPFRTKEQTAAALKAKQAVAHIDYEAMGSEVDQLREESVAALARCKAAKDKCDQVHAQFRRIRYPKSSNDYLYGDRDWPQRYPLHTPYCQGRTPIPMSHNKAAIELIKYAHRDATYSPKGLTPPRLVVVANLKDPNMRQLLDATPDDSHEDIMKVLQKIDDWDFDVFGLQDHAKGGSLFMVSLCLFYKYGLVQHFNIDTEVLLNWCSAIESGYHPNPYHNSTHAADVTQILHYILFPGGMHNMINISPEDALASIISGAIHDYDHPGFNNNFHVRTNAYLSTLYNDRSVLENHHCASVFELMKNPKFNLLASLSNEQRKDVRDTIVDVVLSTDMGNHAKIFQTFRKRLQDDAEWQHKEDIRLALSIAIKMADISNTARPQHLYLQWAKKIADEFYNQGDVERKLHFTVSPFMDRLNHKMDFPKGQMSFMNYIVIPLFEAGAEFVPQLEWTVQKIQDNKEYWQRREEDS